MILRPALEWHRHLCPPEEGLAAASLWGRPASRLPRDEFAAVEPAAYRFETAGRVPALPTAKMALPTTHGPVQKKPKKSLCSVPRFNKPGELHIEKIQKVLMRFSRKRRSTLKFHPRHNCS